MLTRRSFLGRSAASAAAAGAWPLVPTLDPPLLGVPVPDGPTRNPVRVLGPTPEPGWPFITKQMSDSVFERLRQPFMGRSLRLENAAYLGEGALAWQINTSYAVYLGTTVPNPFPYAHFLNWTNCWVTGTRIALPGLGDAPLGATPRHLMAEARCVGMPILPAGLLWAAHYLDEDTGLAMRALSVYETHADLIVFRWDVFYG